MKRSSITRSLVPALFVLALAYVPAAGAQATAKVTCKDGTTSTATGRGACSGHGGVAPAAAAKTASKAEKAADKTASKSEKAATKTEKTADKAADKTAKGATKAAAKSEKAADKAAAKSEKAADKAAAKSEKAADKAATKTEVAAGASGEVTAKCKDGTTSKAKNRRGACSGHGGVASWVK